MINKLLLSAFLFLCLNSHGQEAAATSVTVATDAEAAQEQEYDNRTERILGFHVDIRIDKDGLIKIAEHISVFADGQEIKRGIRRSIPLYRKDIYGTRKKVDFKITRILKDGMDESYSTKQENGERVIYIGNPDYYLSSGKYEYTIEYQTRGQIGFFADHDELYWNVTGNNWDFSIEKASATIWFPDGAKPGDLSCYTGPDGSKDAVCSSVINPDNSVTFTANSGFASREGLTVSASFTPFVIKRPGLLERMYNEYLEFGVAFLLLLLPGIFYYRSWSRYGRDPESPVVIPEFKVPENWSPSLMRHLYKRTIDEKVFTVALINMAVKKAVRITKAEGKREAYWIEKIASGDGLANEEQVAHEKLFKTNHRISAVQSNARIFKKAKEALHASIRNRFNPKEYLQKNWKQLFWATLITIGAWVLFFIFVDAVSPLLMLFISMFLLGGFQMLSFAFRSFRLNFFAAFIAFIFGLSFFFAGVAWLFNAGVFLQPVSVIFAAGSLLMFVVYVYQIKSPTSVGLEVKAKIEGFKMYLETAEEHRLNLLNPPEHTPALFEKFLPYAIALDVENAWGKKFQEVLDLAGYEPEWYSGEFSQRGFVASMSGAFSRAVNVSPPPPPGSGSSGSSSGSSGSSSWSSGSSSSGSSGGGGGGGGGGGW